MSGGFLLDGGGVPGPPTESAQLDPDHFFDLTLDLVSVVDDESRFCRLNASWKRVLGYDPAELIGRSMYDLIHPDDLGATNGTVDQVRRGESIQHFENRYRCKDGSYRWISWSAVPIRMGRFRCGIGRDVTELKEKEAALRRSEERLRENTGQLRAILNALPARIALLDSRAKILSVNTEWQVSASATKAESIGRSYFDLCEHVVGLGGQDGAAVASGLQAVLQGEAENFTREYACHNSAAPRWCRLMAARLSREPQCGAVVMHIDVTEERLAREALAKSEAGLARAQRTAQLGSWEWDTVTGHVELSSEVLRICGRPKPAANPVMPELFEWVHPDDRDRVRNTIEGATPAAGLYDLVCRVVQPAGEVRVVHALGNVVRDEAGWPARVTGTVQDVTERHLLQNRLAIADRMASVGTLAAGVAHEINNPLSYVLANLAFACESIQKQGELTGSSAWIEDALDVLRQAMEGSERIRVIVRDLRTLAQSDEDRKQALDVRRSLESAISISASEIRRRALLVRDYGDVSPVEANEARLIQVFVNVIVNAVQAIPEGAVDHHEIRIATRMNEKGWVVAEVRDTGPGISPEVLSRIFDPFFTTKPVGVGPGLGLSICHGIVTSLGGEIEVRSEMGKGTAVRVALPPAART